MAATVAAPLLNPLEPAPLNSILSNFFVFFLFFGRDRTRAAHVTFYSLLRLHSREGGGGGRKFVCRFLKEEEEKGEEEGANG